MSEMGDVIESKKRSEETAAMTSNAPSDPREKHSGAAPAPHPIDPKKIAAELRGEAERPFAGPASRPFHTTPTRTLLRRAADAIEALERSEIAGYTALHRVVQERDEALEKLRALVESQDAHIDAPTSKTAFAALVASLAARAGIRRRGEGEAMNDLTKAVEKWARWVAPKRDDATSKTWWHFIPQHEERVCGVTGDTGPGWVPELRFDRPTDFNATCLSCLRIVDPSEYGDLDD